MYLHIVSRLLIALAALVEVGCSEARVSPLQTRFNIELAQPGAPVLAFIATKTAKQTSMRLRSSLSDFGGEKGRLTTYELYNDKVIAVIHNDFQNCTTAPQGGPIFSDQSFFVSIFAHSTSGSMEDIQAVRGALEEQATAHGGRVVSAERSCESADDEKTDH